jgi:hypothetical protein
VGIAVEQVDAGVQFVISGASGRDAPPGVFVCKSVTLIDQRDVNRRDIDQRGTHQRDIDHRDQDPFELQWP